MGSVGANTGRSMADVQRELESEVQVSIDEQVRQSPDYIGQREIENQINEQIRYSLDYDEEYASVDSFRIISNPGGGELGDVEATYQVTLRIPYTETDADGYSQTYYDTEYEYRTDTFQVILKRRR